MKTSQSHCQKTGKATGIGIKHFLTDSRGRQIENPKLYEKTLKGINNTCKNRNPLFSSLFFRLRV
ncbi:hypothetical protein MTTB_06670 [Methanothermobacter tenebrarum]|uniref:Uncharacterized protein n=1 Tax=Methanothermobacter tenebrarum TaxID=680118 RepID=A0ABM7YD16_9EURY|nr:hypothetical protein MTTB_06670 [Methanothermobacter tenebrarum]